MPLLGVLVEGEPVPLDQVTPDTLMPEIVEALKPDPNRNETDEVHLSYLGTCAWKKKMELRLGYYLPPEVCYRMIRGKSWDCLIEKYRRPGACLYHKRYYKTVNGILISGEPDLIDLDLATIEDYKAPTYDNTKGRVYPAYAFQLNGYVWLTEGQLTHPDSGESVEIESLWLNTCGPKFPIRIEVPLWPKRIRDAEVDRRLEEYLAVMQSDELRPCGDPDCIFCNQEVYWVEI